MKLSIVLIFILSLQTFAKADNISEFEIEGLSVGDSLLNFASEQEIKKAKAKEQFSNDKYIIYRYDLLKSPTQYDWISVTAKKMILNISLQILQLSLIHI